MNTSHLRTARQRRLAVARATVALTFIGGLVLGSAVPAGAAPTVISASHAVASPIRVAAPIPPPPPNPSDDDIEGSENAANAAAGEVGKLSGRVTATENRIETLQDDMQSKQELVNKAYVDLEVAKDDAVQAAAAAATARDQAARADTAVTVAEQKAAAFAAASFRNGSVIGSEAALLDARDLNDLLARDALLEQVSESQLDFIGNLQTARNRKASADAAARAAQEKALAAQQAAEQAASFAEQAKDAATIALGKGQTELDALQTQLTTQQAAYRSALDNTASLKSQREAYDQWLVEKKAEEERQRVLAEQRRQAAIAEAARKAAVERAAAEARAQALAEAKAQAEADRQAALRAAQAQAAREASIQAAADAEERRIAAVAEQNNQKAAAAAARQAAADRRTAANAAASRQAAAAQAAADARAAASAAASRRAAAAQRAADQRASASAAASRQAAAAKAAADSRAAASAAASRRAAAARRAADQRAASAAADARRQSALRAQATERARVAAARRAKEMADKLKQIRGNGTGGGSYFQNCDAARSAGFAPMRRGEPGYRAGLDPNDNGIACDAGTGSDPSAGSGSSGGGSVSVPSDGSKGAIVVNAALKWLGTPYSWGGGNSSGPTTGIRAGCTSTCQQYEPWNTVGFDCSGLTLYAWAQAGVSLPHYSAYQFQSGQRISRSDLQPGDLVFFANNTSDWTTIHHVAIYLGNGQLIEAPQSGVPVRIRGWRDDGYIGAVRPGT